MVEIKKELEAKMIKILTKQGNLNQETSVIVEKIIRSNNLKTVILHRMEEENTDSKMLLYSLVKKLNEEQRKRL